MSAASITVEDETGPGGQPAVSLKLIFSGGFNPLSPAHQAAQALLKLWDQELGAERIGTPLVDPVIVNNEPMLAIAEGAEAVRTETAEASRIVVEQGWKARA